VASRVSSPSFIGRAAELERVRGALERARSGTAGVVLVAGESGVGKSRLLGELVPEADALVLRGECVELAEGELPYAPVVGALRDLVRVVEPGMLDALPATGRNELGRLAPELARDAAPAGPPSQPVLFEAVLALLARLSEDEPVLLVLEDVHWADRSTRDLLAFLARNLSRERVLLVATYRTDELHRRHPLRGLLAEVERLPRTERIMLDRLSRAEVAELLAAILEAEPDTGLVQRVHDRSEGNPFFAEELLAAGAEGSLPDTLRDALMLRIEALSDDAQHLLRVLATAGRPITGAVLAGARGTSVDALSAPLREAVSHNIVSVSDDEHFRFRHALFGEAVYDDLLPGERARLHRALAESLAADPALAGVSESIAAAELAHHWYAAHDLPAALSAAVRAGSSSRAAGAHAEAARQFGTALELWAQVPDAEERTGIRHAELVGQAGQAAHVAGYYEQGIALLTQAAEAFEALGDGTDAGIAYTRLGRCLWAAGRANDGLAAHARAVELMPPTETAERAQALALRARMLTLSDQIESALPIAEEALAIARAVGAREAEGHALNTLGIDVSQLGDRERGIELLRDALEIAQELGTPDELGSAYVNLAEEIDQAGRIEDAAELAIEGIEVSRREGGGRLFGTFLASEAALRFIRLGRYDRADELVAEAFALNPEGQARAALHQARAQLLIERGDPGAAELEVERGGALVELTISQWIAPLAAAAAEAALWLGEPERALRIGERGLDQLGETPFASQVVPLHAHTLRAEADRRALERARSAAPARPGRAAELEDGLEALLAPNEGPEVHAWVALARAEARRAEGAAAAPAFSAAADAFAALDMPFRSAYARLREVEAELAGGAGGRDVADRLGAARALASDIGAPLLLAQIDALARRGRVPIAAGQDAGPAEPHGLTARELEVLGLVAEGYTNREIGARLYMSDKTASVHVSRILVKLSVRNRGEAAAVAHRLGLT
jgi:DNA-binding CsgD family transcriptional regulator/tetratricopeptide (TPR) repeat protein